MSWDGRYRLERTLGEGGMGRVLLAADLAAEERPLAVKILLPEYRNSTSGFMAEFVTQRSFHHPNIPEVYEVGFANHPRGGEVPYFTLEYCRGVSLYLAIPRLRALDQAWPWMEQVLRALDYVHGRGWLHRDLKPGNILVDTERPGDTSTKLIDLGVASRLGDPPEELFIGTPEYCAPEMLAGYPFDERSDLYAFGLILYEVIEGRRPWPGSDEQLLLDSRLGTPPPPITHPECPPALTELVLALLQPQPQKRPRQAAEVLERFGQAVGRQVPLELPDAFARRLHGVVFPRREAVVAAGERTLTGIAPGTDAESNVTKALLIESPPGFDGGSVAHEVADRAAVQGARVIRFSLGRACENELDGLRPALIILQRLRAEQAGGVAPEPLPGPAGAAAMLSRLDTPTVLLIENIQRMESRSLQVLHAVFTGSRTPNLRLLATTDPGEPAVAPPFKTFLRAPYVATERLPEPTLEDAATWFERAVGRGVLSLPAITDLHGESGRTPAGLTAALVDLFRRGVLKRTRDGFVVEGDTRRKPLPLSSPGALEQLLSCLRHPMPRGVVERYLDSWAPRLPELLARGTLVESGADQLAIGDESWRQGMYDATPAVVRMRLHRRLAQALHAAPAFRDQRSLVAAELLLSDKPAHAAPHLVTAASEAVGADSSQRATRYLDRAQELLEKHLGPAEEKDAWRWWVMLLKARVRLALAEGDLEKVDAAAEQLVGYGSDAAHMPTLAFALETRMVAAFERSAWSQLVQHAESRLALEGDQPSPDARGFFLWAEGLRLRAFGETTAALEALRTGLGTEAARPRPGVALRLAASRTDVLVDIEDVHEGERAAAAALAAAQAASDPAQTARARIQRAVLHRQAGRPEAALELLLEVAHDMPGEHLRHASCLLELELARIHLAFGWIDTARDHAGQARELAARDRLPAREAMAEAVEAAALRLTGRTEEGRRLLDAAYQAGRDALSWTELTELRLAMLEYGLADGVTEREQVQAEAESLAAQAARRKEYPRAGRAFALAARAAMERRDHEGALDLAERALSAADRRPGWEADIHGMVWVLAQARRSARQHRAADTLEQRALEQLRRVAATIRDPARRRDWLAVPAHAAIQGGTAVGDL
ncbi:MAG: serine/threonine protein kinase [Deltaproteobacteria bacterium]|nr:serine/threonine protein kinase [Deltaproteobacteria bacterium]MCB9788647.1 serine/threonine protein kinase [Deltaproteobacteria bacterium]